MKKLVYFLSTILTLVITSCNDEWTDELYENYVSFKAPLNNLGLTNVYVKYQSGGKSTYNLPVIVSGTNANESEITAQVALDPDTLASLNYDRFQNRKEFYYTLMADSLYSIPDMTVKIPARAREGLLPINFNFHNIDMFYKWVLPLTIVSGPGCTPHPRKNYKKAILRVIPFTDFSGTYQSTNMNVYLKGSTKNPFAVNTRQAYVVNDSTIFFYAGSITDDDVNRYVYKIYVTFNPDNTLTVTAANSGINFKLNSPATYSVDSHMDEKVPYLMFKYVQLNLDYSFDDITSLPGTAIGYEARGNMTMVRRINTLIPDEEQAVDWGE